MTIKDILVALAPRDEADPARDFTLSMASVYGAHVTAAAYPIVAEIPGTVFSEFTVGLVQEARDEAEAAVKGARERFEQAARIAGVDHSFHGHTSFVHAAAADFAMHLRTADVGVLTQHKDDVERVGDFFMEAALFRSGRPVIIVPKGHTARFSCERVMIAWDGSVHATRAVAGAMPLLENATIEVFTAEEASKGHDYRGNALVDHLRHHGLNAGLAQRHDRDVPGAILQEAQSFRATLVVMGGYGHSRFREFVFGGATRAMLEKMNVPVLMAH